MRTLVRDAVDATIAASTADLRAAIERGRAAMGVVAWDAVLAYVAAATTDILSAALVQGFQQEPEAKP